MCPPNDRFPKSFLSETPSDHLYEAVHVGTPTRQWAKADSSVQINGQEDTGTACALYEGHVSVEKQVVYLYRPERT